MRKIYLSVLYCVCLWTPSLFAQDEFEEVQVLDRPRYSLTGRPDIVVDGSFLPLDGYFKPLMIEGAFNYQPTDWLSWEVARFGYVAYNHDTGLEASINQVLTNAGVDKQIAHLAVEMKDLQYHVSSTAFFNMLYSKSNLFNMGVVYYYWQLGGGYSFYGFDHGQYQNALDLAMRIRFFINDHFTLNVRGGHSIGFSSDVPNNITFLGLGVGFAF